jgi:glycogen(starch) synthase
MRVVTLTWEYPPRIVGEMARYTQSLCQELAERGFETHVVTYNEDLKGVRRESSGVVVHRVSNPVSTHLNILTWALTLSTEFERVCSDINYDIGSIDLLDCQDWTSVPSTVSLSKAFRIPYIMTIHSLEEQRIDFPDNPMSLTIRYFERLGTQSSSAVIVKSKIMKEEVQRLHNLSEDKVQCVPQDPAFGERIAWIYAAVGQRKSELMHI